MPMGQESGPVGKVPAWYRQRSHPVLCLQELEREGEPSIEEQVGALGELIKEGKIRHW